MNNLKYFLIYALLVVAQILLGNFLNLGQYVMLCFLPTMILVLPTRFGNIATMLIAFATGLFVDFFTHGILGLTIIALVPVALMRRWVISMVFGGELLSRKEDINIARLGLPKVALAVLIVTALFFMIYVWVDGAGTRPVAFNFIRMGASIAASTLVSLYIAHVLTSEEVGRWR